MARTRLATVLAGLTALLAHLLVAQQARTPLSEAVVPPDPVTLAYVSGVVQMSDGSLVPKETVVELICDGFPRATDQVDPKGEFDIELSGRGVGLVDATQDWGRARDIPQANHLGVVNMNNCFVRAELPGHQSTQILLGVRSVFDNPDIGELVLSRAEEILGHAISPSTAQAPKKAAQHYEWSVREVAKPRSNLKRMATRLESAVGIDPSFAAAWHLLGQVRESLGLSEDALDAYRQALAADPYLYPVYTSVVPLLVGTGDMPGTIEMGEKGLEINPNLDELRFFVAGAYLRSGQNEECIEKALELVERGATTTYPQAHQFLGAAYANLGKFQPSASHFRQFLELSPEATAADAIRNQIAEWERLGVTAPGTDAR